MANRVHSPAKGRRCSAWKPEKTREWKAVVTSESSVDSGGESVFRILQNEAQWLEGLCHPVEWPLAACGCLSGNQFIKMETLWPGQASLVPALMPTSSGSVGGCSRHSRACMGQRGTSIHLPDESLRPLSPGWGNAPGHQPPRRMLSPFPEGER